MEILDLNGNQIENVPDNVGDLTKLRRLRLSDNNITELPDSLATLNELKSIQIENNPLEKLPESLCKRWKENTDFIKTDKEYDELCD